MRIVNAAEFIKLPAGVVFSYWNPGTARQLQGLYSLAEYPPYCKPLLGSLYYYEIQLTAEVTWKATPAFKPTEQQRMIESKQLYAVYDLEDLAKMSELITAAIATETKLLARDISQNMNDSCPDDKQE